MPVIPPLVASFGEHAPPHAVDAHAAGLGIATGSLRGAPQLVGWSDWLSMRGSRLSSTARVAFHFEALCGLRLERISKASTSGKFLRSCSRKKLQDELRERVWHLQAGKQHVTVKTAPLRRSQEWP